MTNFDDRQDLPEEEKTAVENTVPAEGNAAAVSPEGQTGTSGETMSAPAAPGSGYFRPDSSPVQSAFAPFTTPASGGNSYGYSAGASGNPAGQYANPYPGAGSASSQNAPQNTVPGFGGQAPSYPGGGVPPRGFSYGYGGQPPVPPKPPVKKKSNTALIVTVIVLAFILLVGSAAAVAYGISKNVYLPGPDDSQTSDGIGDGSPSGEKNPHVGSNVLYGNGNGFENNGGIASDDAISNAAVYCSKSVVAITTSSAAYSAFYGNYVTQGAGSGVLYAEQADGDGKVTGTYIVTNNHVIDGANEITVTLYDGKQYPAELVGTDAQTDVAVIYISATDLKDCLASLGESSSLLLGQTVLAIGNPLGELAGTVTNGIISCLERAIDVGGVKMNLLQTNAAVNPGNSGGGLFNLNGQLIGVVNAKSSGEGIEGLGFAIPIDTVKKVAKELMDYGYVTGRPKIGVTGYEVTSENYSSYRSAAPQVWNYINQYYSASGGRLLEGMYIFGDENVNYAGSENKFEEGDVLSAIDGQRVTDGTSITEVLSGYEIGDTVTVTVWRLVNGSNKLRPTVSIQSFDIQVVLVDTAPPANNNAEPAE